jgi:hypothetical protein
VYPICFHPKSCAPMTLWEYRFAVQQSVDAPVIFNHLLHCNIKACTFPERRLPPKFYGKNIIKLKTSSQCAWWSLKNICLPRCTNALRNSFRHSARRIFGIWRTTPLVGRIAEHSIVKWFFAIFIIGNKWSHLKFSQKYGINEKWIDKSIIFFSIDWIIWDIEEYNQNLQITLLTQT